MAPLAPNETLVMEGTFLYDGIVECDVCVARSPIRYGSGDYEDPPEIYNDLERDTFYVYYGSTTERGRYTAGGVVIRRLRRQWPERSQHLVSVGPLHGRGLSMSRANTSFHRTCAGDAGWSAEFNR